jgi:hypothetical protein
MTGGASAYSIGPGPFFAAFLVLWDWSTWRLGELCKPCKTSRFVALRLLTDGRFHDLLTSALTGSGGKVRHRVNCTHFSRLEKLKTHAKATGHEGNTIGVDRVAAEQPR